MSAPYSIVIVDRAGNSAHVHAPTWGDALATAGHYATDRAIRHIDVQGNNYDVSYDDGDARICDDVTDEERDDLDEAIHAARSLRGAA